MKEVYITLKRRDSKIGNIKIVFPSSLRDINTLIGRHEWEVVGTNINNIELGTMFNEKLYEVCQHEIEKVNKEEVAIG